jgi:hypothetical protein
LLPTLGERLNSTHPADVSSNFVIDQHIFGATLKAETEGVIIASSICEYSPKLQDTADSHYLLKEDDSNPYKLDKSSSADKEYGGAKLTGEVRLIVFITYGALMT